MAGLLGDNMGTAYGLLDIAGALTGGNTDNYGKFDTRRIADERTAMAAQKEMAKRQAKAQEVLREQQQSQAIGQQWMNPKVVEEMGGFAGPPQTTGGGLPSNPEEYAAGMSRLMGGGQLDPQQANAMLGHLTGYTAPKNVSAGAAMVDPLSGLPIAQQAPSDVQSLQYLMQNPEAMAAQKALDASGAAQTNIQLGPQLTPAQEAIDKKYAADYLEYTSGGGADSAKMLAQLKDVHSELGKRDDLTGPVVGNVPEWLAPITNPDAVAAKEQVEEVVQRNLKAVLGAQFTEKEGERLIARAYNPKLSEAENQKRLGRLIKQMESAAESKRSAAEYMQKNGTMQGWQGKVPTIEDFNSALDEPNGGWSIKRK